MPKNTGDRPRWRNIGAVVDLKAAACLRARAACAGGGLIFTACAFAELRPFPLPPHCAFIPGQGAGARAAAGGGEEGGSPLARPAASAAAAPTIDQGLQGLLG